MRGKGENPQTHDVQYWEVIQAEQLLGLFVRL